jgi:hypothetical protein
MTSAIEKNIVTAIVMLLMSYMTSFIEATAEPGRRLTASEYKTEPWAMAV